ncbi:hypothetical protein BDV06DRAFT_227126 [Aspergillus oleicola]
MSQPWEIPALNQPQNLHIFSAQGDYLGGVNGKVLARSTRSGPLDHRVSDDCLRWHYRQAILTHMRGEGEKPWEAYEDLEGDIRAIRKLPKAGKILEAEFGNHLGAYVDVDHEHSDHG